VLRNHRIAVIIPALNEEDGIVKVLEAIPGWVDDLIVVDNGSTDATASISRSKGARVIDEPRRGYGAACLAGIETLENPDVVVFLDADFSDHPEEMASLVDPIIDDEADLVIGARVPQRREPGALTIQSRFGNWLACHLVALFWGIRYTDLGPFRAIRFVSLKIGLRALEVPVSYRRRIGRSKISGTIRGTLGAGVKILRVIFRHGIMKTKSRRTSG
jgi:glycosyltransferase involved in cell wall biosynthesis